jgi:hypothetical protein
MANTSSPNGFRPVRPIHGGAPRRNAYTIQDQYATSLFSGDPVKSSGTGRNIVAAAVDDKIIGIFDGCEYVTAAGEVVFRKYWPASTDAVGPITAWVYDDPEQEFEAQITTVAEADINLSADASSASGSTATGRSAWSVNGSDLNGSSGQWKVMGLINRPDNAYGAYAKVRVIAMLHENRGALTPL